MSGAVGHSSGLWPALLRRMAPTERQRLFGLTVAIGGVCGLAAVAFHLAIGAISHRAIDRAFAFGGHAWIPAVIVVTAFGALFAGIVMYAVAPGARGSGIPQVKAAYALGGRVPLRDAVAKFALAAVQLGTGSSLGREGPTVQICAGVATWLGRLARVSAQNLRLLLPVGAAAGVAAAFNAPLAAVTFTIEEVIGTLDPTMLSGVVVAAALAAVIEHGLLGGAPVLSIPVGYGLGHPSALVFYALLGIAAGVASLAFSSSLLGLRAWTARQHRVPGWARPALGGLATGAIAVCAMLAVERRGIDGGGYDTLTDALAGMVPLQAMLVLGLLKLAATATSYGSGGSGGLFAPSLFVGGMLGGAIGFLDVTVFGPGHAELGAFAVVGMGAVFAGTVRAPITSILIIVEMTGGYALVLPLMIANITAYAIARHVSPVPIYEALLLQDGIDLHRRASTTETVSVPLPAPELLRPRCFAPDDGVERLVAAVEVSGRQEVFPVVDRDGRLRGVITIGDLAELADARDAGDLVRAVDVMRPPIAVRADEPAARALELMHETGLRQVPMTDGAGAVIGLTEEVTLARAYLQARRAAARAATATPPAH